MWRGDLTDDLRMYMRRCHAYILVNKSYNNAVITNDFFLFVYVIILFVLYILYYMYIIMEFWGGGGGSQCTPPLYATLLSEVYVSLKIFLKYFFQPPTSKEYMYCILVSTEITVGLSIITASSSMGKLTSRVPSTVV